MIEGEIKVHDNVLSMDDRHGLFENCMQENYHLGWKDDTYTQDVFLHKVLNDSHVPGLLDGYFRNVFKEDIEHHRLVQTVINCGVPGAINRAHRDQWGDRKHRLVTCLYMANMQWDSAWGGELKFWDSHSDEVRHVCNYRPGRVIAFDGEMNHCAGSYSYKADYFRFTIASWYIAPD